LVLIRRLILSFVVWLALAILVLVAPVYSEDGTYDAIVTTDSGSYTVPVEVEGGEIAFVHWPNGGDMHVYGATVEDGAAEGWNSRGEHIAVEIDGDEGGEENSNSSSGGK